MIYSAHILAQTIVESCVLHHIKHVIISPGSRNAPLIIGFTNHPKIKTYTIVDERCAAFFALGIAQQNQETVAIVCTSGSALLNYYPAISEAFYSCIPLLVISADRPKHLIDIGDGQTIRQENVFNNHILFNANLKENDDQNEALIRKALLLAASSKGPVHLNAPFDEPLYSATEDLMVSLNPTSHPEQRLPSVNFDHFRKKLQDASKVLILVGVSNPNLALEEYLTHLLSNPAVLLLTETTSNLNLTQRVGSIDRLINTLSDEEMGNLRPDILITFGGMVISKKIKNFLRGYQPTKHWHIDAHRSLDTYFCLTDHIEIAPEHFFQEMIKVQSTNKSNYQKTWLDLNGKKEMKHLKFMQNVAFSDLKAIDLILQSIPHNYALQLSNSAVVRYVQLFENKEGQTNCNRGTSGIDGSTSTALGAASVNPNPTLLITGDVSFFYDSNALWNKYIKSNFRIIIINNNGGGIFKILPGPSSTNALSYFETPHNLDAKHLCKMYHISYSSANGIEEMENRIETFYKEDDRPKLLEIFTPTDVNDKVLKEYFQFIA